MPNTLQVLSAPLFTTFLPGLPASPSSSSFLSVPDDAHFSVVYLDESRRLVLDERVPRGVQQVRHCGQHLRRRRLRPPAPPHLIGRAPPSGMQRGVPFHHSEQQRSSPRPLSRKSCSEKDVVLLSCSFSSGIKSGQVFVLVSTFSGKRR